MKKRAILVVIDSMGCGAIEDAADYGDDLTCNTLCNLANATGGLNVPNFEKLGLGNIVDIKIHFCTFISSFFNITIRNF